MDLKDIGFYLHFLIPIGFILMPLLPVKHLKYAIFFPPLIYLIWIVCDGCPLTQATQGADEKFIEGMIVKVSPALAGKTDQIIGFILTFVLAIIAFRAFNSKCKVK
jgi:hypothetical protein